MPPKTPGFLKRVQDYFLPHRGNGYKPHVFRFGSIATILLVVIVLEGAYLGEVDIVFPHTNFLAAVLPGTLIALTNTDRTDNDVPTVTENPLLDKAATLAAEDMASKGYFAHVSPSGVTPWDWLTQVGYQYTYAGENLAVNFTDSTAVDNAWMASPTHRANIVKPQYSQIGIGVANGMYEGQEATFVVQFFGAPLIVVPVSKPGVPTPMPAPKPTVIATSARANSTNSGRATTTQVLGTQISPTTSAAAAPSLFVEAAASPTHTILLILSLLLGAVLLLFVIAIIVKLRVQYLEIIGGGLVLLAVLVGFILYDSHSAGETQIPASNQDSSVVNSGV